MKDCKPKRKYNNQKNQPIMKWIVKGTNNQDLESSPIESSKSLNSNLCDICCETLEIVALGSCGHYSMCALCFLRLHLLYKDSVCPFCKQDLERVFLLKYDSNIDNQTYSFCMRNIDKFSKDFKWAANVYCQKLGNNNNGEKESIINILKEKTNICCILCSTTSSTNNNRIVSFKSYKLLREHLKEHHDHDLCGLCVKANRKFSTELDLFKIGSDEFRHHVKSHPKCHFCKITYYDKDELFVHMNQTHCKCHLCERHSELRNNYFRNGADLIRHLQEKHYACSHQACIEMFVAFGTSLELQIHRAQVHGNRTLSQQQQQQGRLRLELDYPLRGRPGLPNQRRITISEMYDDDDDNSSEMENVTQNRRQSRHAHQSSEPGLVIIDDDVPPSDDMASLSLANQNAFPSLPTPDPSFSSNTTNTTTISNSFISITIYCQCKQRSQKQFIKPNAPIPKLACNSECERHKRSKQLADAFKIQNSENYVPVFQRPIRKLVKFPFHLINWARKYPVTLKEYEKELQERFSDKNPFKLLSKKINKNDKWTIELLTQCYGLNLRQINREGESRYETIISGQPVIPNPLLSDYIANLSIEEFEDIKIQYLKTNIIFYDISSTVNIHNYLNAWKGKYTWDWDAENRIEVHFENESDFNEAMSRIAGGIRSQFRTKLPNEIIALKKLQSNNMRQQIAGNVNCSLDMCPQSLSDWTSISERENINKSNHPYSSQLLTSGQSNLMNPNHQKMSNSRNYQKNYRTNADKKQNSTDILTINNSFQALNTQDDIG